MTISPTQPTNYAISPIDYSLSTGEEKKPSEPDPTVGFNSIMTNEAINHVHQAMDGFKF